MDEHVLQCEPNYCVPACITMIQIWRGHWPADSESEQFDLFMLLNFRGLCSLLSCNGMFGIYLPWFDIDEPSSIEALAALIDDGNRAIVTCLPGPFGQWLRARGIVSPHGELPSGPLPWHALCVAGRTERHFVILDPWTPSEYQPLCLSFESFAEAWTGEVLLCARDF